ITRLSFINPPGLIYQNATVTYKVNGDLLDRSIDIPGLAIIHKRPGDELLTKFETYIDTASLVPVIKERFMRFAARSERMYPEVSKARVPRESAEDLK
ncbi:hypothetical protein FRC06_001769, partial [Ceratobasidium sp. 370]